MQIRNQTIIQVTMMKPRPGDLIYVPSEVTLFKTEKGSPLEIKEWKKIESPSHLLVTAVNDSTYEVFYENKYWLVAKDKVYDT